MDKKSELNKKINELVEDLDQPQKDKIYQSLSKIIDAISEMSSDGSINIPIPPKPKKCSNCGANIA